MTECLWVAKEPDPETSECEGSIECGMRAHICSNQGFDKETSHKWKGIDKYTAKIIKWEMEMFKIILTMANKKLRIILFFLCINHLVFQHRIQVFLSLHKMLCFFKTHYLTYIPTSLARSLVT